MAHIPSVAQSLHCTNCGQLRNTWFMQGYDTLLGGERVPWRLCSMDCARELRAKRKFALIDRLESEVELLKRKVATA